MKAHEKSAIHLYTDQMRLHLPGVSFEDSAPVATAIRCNSGASHTVEKPARGGNEKVPRLGLKRGTFTLRRNG
jgi:hypothetical protein